MNGVGKNSFRKAALAIATLIGIAIWPLTCPAELALSVSPASPRDRDSIYLKIPANLEMGHYLLSARTTMEAMKIIAWFDVEQAGFPEAPPTPAFSVPLGQLPAGTYQVEARGSDGRTFGSMRFEVKARTGSTTPNVNYSDMWWNPAESGWGVSIHQHSTDVIFAVWFVYGSDGKPLWYVMPSGNWISSQIYRGSIYRTNGPWFRDRFDPARVGITQVGTGTFRFDGMEIARFEYEIDGAEIVAKNLQRQSF
jgi:hypothetical protein